MTTRTLKFRIGAAVLGMAVLVTALYMQTTRAAEPAVAMPLPALDAATPAPGDIQTAVLAGGCFWGVQAVYQYTEGVISAVSGYSGGTRETARYDIVSTGRSTHAESVEIKFDPRKISYGRILQIFFSVVHNPTELNRQGPDEGPHYRSAIFYANPEQKRIAEAYIKQLGEAKAFRKPIVTRVDPLEAFYRAEAYHQDYAILNPRNPYIYIHDLPKIENLRRMLPEVYRPTPVTVAAAARQN